MIKVLMVCHGNICRSPMAEFLLKDMVKKEGCPIEVASAAVSNEEEGNPVYPPVRALLKRMGIDCSGKRARVITASDLEDYDFIILMDASNFARLKRRFPGLPQDKIKMLLDFTDRSGEDIADPWYTRDFERTRADIQEGLEGLMAYLKQEGRI